MCSGGSVYVCIRKYMSLNETYGKCVYRNINIYVSAFMHIFKGIFIYLLAFSI